MTVVKVTDATAEPVTLADAKAFARVETTDDDALITAMITAARQVAEQEMQRTVITSVYKMTTDGFPSYTLDLPYPMLQSVASVKYYDTDGVLQTWNSANYRVDLASSVLTPVDAWPATQVRPDAIEVNYTAGWLNPASVPHSVKSWILIRIATLYENRVEYANTRDAAAVRMPFVGGLLDPYRVVTI